MAVTPVVGFLGDINLQALSPSKEEIASVFTVPLVDLSDPSKLSFREAGFRGREVHLPVFQAKDPKNPIWGLTAFILYHFLRTILCVPLPEVKK